VDVARDRSQACGFYATRRTVGVEGQGRIMARAIVVGGGTVGEPTGRGLERARSRVPPEPRGLVPRCELGVEVPQRESDALVNERLVNERLVNERMEEIVQTALERGLTETRLEPEPKGNGVIGTGRADHPCPSHCCERLGVRRRHLMCTESGIAAR
jgi:hypothetical protein